MALSVVLFACRDVFVNNLAADHRHRADRLENLRLGDFHDVLRETVRSASLQPRYNISPVGKHLTWSVSALSVYLCRGKVGQHEQHY